MNTVVLVGRAYDIKESETLAGKKAISFNLSVEETLGDKKEYSSFWINAYSGLAEIVSTYWREGKLVSVDGRINQFRDAAGGVKYSIMAKSIRFYGDVKD